MTTIFERVYEAVSDFADGVVEGFRNAEAVWDSAEANAQLASKLPGLEAENARLRGQLQESQRRVVDVSVELEETKQGAAKELGRAHRDLHSARMLLNDARHDATYAQRELAQLRKVQVNASLARDKALQPLRDAEARAEAAEREAAELRRHLQNVRVALEPLTKAVHPTRFYGDIHVNGPDVFWERAQRRDELKANEQAGEQGNG